MSAATKLADAPHEFRPQLGSFIWDPDFEHNEVHLRRAAREYEVVAQYIVRDEHNPATDLVSALISDMIAHRDAADALRDGRKIEIYPPRDLRPALHDGIRVCRDVAEALAVRIEDDLEQNDALNLISTVFRSVESLCEGVKP